MGRKFPKYKLTDKQIRGIANIVLHEQGTVAGWYAEASQIANRTDIKGNEFATAERIVKTVTGGWYAHGLSRYKAGTNNKRVIEIVKRVLCEGYRTLPRYIDEHDCMSDILKVLNGEKDVKINKTKWIKHHTVIKNKMNSSYIFYCFPGGSSTNVDPFGYTDKAARTKWGDFYYTVEEAEARIDSMEDDMPIIKHGSTGKAVKIWQIIVGVKDVNGIFRDVTEKATREFQKKHGLKVDGIVGKFTWSAGLGTL